MRHRDWAESYCRVRAGAPQLTSCGRRGGSCTTHCPELRPVCSHRAPAAPRVSGPCVPVSESHRSFPESRTGRRPAGLPPRVPAVEPVLSTTDRRRKTSSPKVRRQLMAPMLRRRRLRPGTKPSAYLEHAVYTKPYLKSFMAEAVVETENYLGTHLESQTESDIGLDPVEVPLFPTIEHFPSVAKSDDVEKGRRLPSILGVHHRGVISVKPVEPVAAQRIGTAQCRLQVERYPLARVGVGQRRRSVQRDHPAAV